MNSIHILFTGIGRRVELVQAFREAALIQGKSLKIYGVDSSLEAPALAFCDYQRQVCGMKQESYIEELMGICRTDQIRLLIPTIDTDLIVLAESREKFEQLGTKVLISSPEMIHICRDKSRTSQFFMDCGLKAPMPVSSWKEYKGDFPAFIKPRDGSSSINAYKVEQEKDIESYAYLIEDYIIQPFIEGTEYTVDMFCDFKGNPVFIIPRIRLAVRAGEVQKTQIDMDAKIIDECRKIADRFHPCGPITIQLIREKKSGDDYFIEINPRFGGGAPLSMRAGANSPEVLLRLLSNEEAGGKKQSICDGVVYSRFDQSVCISENRKFPVGGVIFDLDDTLYSEKEYVRSGYQAVARYLGDEALADRLWDYFEHGKLAIDFCLEELGKSELKQECLSIYRKHWPDIRLYDGVEELIYNLKKQEIKVGIITDGRPEGQRNKITALGLEKLVDDFIITDELGGAQFRKPCDIAFRIMARKWRMPYEGIIYVGDNAEKDFQAPQQLGMRCVLFQNQKGIYQYGNEISCLKIKDIKETINII